MNRSEECNVEEFCPRCCIAEEIKTRFPELIIHQPWPHTLHTEHGKLIARIMNELLENEILPGWGLICFDTNQNFITVREYPHVNTSTSGRTYYEPKYQAIVTSIAPDAVATVLTIIADEEDPTLRLIEYYLTQTSYWTTVEVVGRILDLLDTIKRSND